MANNDQIKVFGETHRQLPSTQYPETNGMTPARYSRYGEQFVSAMFGSKMSALADEASYYVATNPTPGTGIATIAAPTTLVDTSPFMIITNGNTAASGIRLYLDYLRLQCTAAGTAGASIRVAIKVDNVSTRYTSGGSSITPVNVNIASTATSGAVIKAGALVATAANAARLLGATLLRPVIPVVGDTYLLNFGPDVKGLNGLAVAGTAIANIEYDTQPVVIEPQCCALVHIWLPSQSAASSYEFELGYWER